MTAFGLLSSVFDYLTFALLLFLLQATPAEFRTGWFMESVISASCIVLVIRSRRPFYRSRPATILLLATLLVTGATLVLPWTPLAEPLGFAPLPWYFYLFIAGMVAVYVIAAELTKRFFYRWAARGQ
jgi:Mg2+-importing ATPase